MEIKSIIENLPYKIKDINLADSEEMQLVFLKKKCRA